MNDFPGRFIIAQTEKNRMTQSSVAGPFRESDLADQFGLISWATRCRIFGSSFANVSIRLNFVSSRPSSADDSDAACVRGHRVRSPGDDRWLLGRDLSTRQRKPFHHANEEIEGRTEIDAIFFQRIAPLEEHTGSILWQLPPMLRKDPDRLNHFCDSCQRGTARQNSKLLKLPSW